MSAEDRYMKEAYEETRLQKLKRKCREEPFVPAGVALTCFALGAATYGVKKGRRSYANNMLRVRVAAQGFTIAAMIVGSFVYTQNTKASARNNADSSTSSSTQQ
ncbi:hypoxia induced protein conserved region-domain-containing protein [Umbelopsis sp. PMI_123]|nr:hypoxia induced protein conserved region-domain-containing protein [Umbelopsis sp. PMI_123]